MSRAIAVVLKNKNKKWNNVVRKKQQCYKKNPLIQQYNDNSDVQSNYTKQYFVREDYQGYK